MLAAYIRATGGVEQIEVGRLPTPVPGPTDVLVRMGLSDVNHVDLFVRSGAYRTHTPFPFVLGRDLVGTVAATGPGVTEFAPGDRVWCNSLGHGGRQGAFAEYAVAAADRVYPLPAGVSADAAAPVLHAAATAHIGLFREARLAPGETVLVGGAGGAVGSAVVQLAAAGGARVVATSSRHDVAWCTESGAAAVIPYDAEGFDEQVRAAAPDGYDVWWDNSGRHDFEATLPLMRAGGRVVVMAGLGAAPVLPVGALYMRDLSLLGFAISNASVSDLAAAAKVINAGLASGRLRGRVGATYALADAAKAHAAMESGSVRGRILVRP
ncbi:zinc-binding dehydrogenase [Amycolatopsis sp. K13G38]|uniref:Zinc-binding dehydrogenase n=2 Tax=Amycolatopsis acididurans TaxID=2724524 RepID=A0ABX1J3J3_9PSEU|nr:zinc-binding dehydrogenase [Amycolatopsis acididurans]